MSVRDWLTQVRADEEGPYYHVTVNGEGAPPIPEPPPTAAWSSSPYGYGDEPPPPDDYDPDEEGDTEGDELARALAAWRQQVT